MTELERLLVDTLHDRAQVIVAPRAFDTSAAPAVRPKCRTSKWLLPALSAAGATAAVVAIVAGVVVSSDPTPPLETSHPETSQAETGQPVPSQPAALVGDIQAPPAGMRAISSLGIEILVPSDWAINDTGCNQSTMPSVVRDLQAVEDCFTPEPADKTVAEIGARDFTWLPFELTDQYFELTPDGFEVKPSPPPMTMEPTTVDGHPAERGEIELQDGRVVALLRFVDDDVAVVVRTPDPAVVTAIFDSVRFVDVDSAGCPTLRPDAIGFLAGATDDALADLDTVRDATLCSYPIRDNPTSRLGSSNALTGAELELLVMGVGELTETATIETDTCSDPRPTPEEDLLIALRLEDGSTRYVVLAEQGCATVAFVSGRDAPMEVSIETYALLWGELIHDVPLGYR